MESTTEYWVWYGDTMSEQARVVAKFDDIEQCREWCDQEFDDYTEMDLSFPIIQIPHDFGAAMIGKVEDFTEK